MTGEAWTVEVFEDARGEHPVAEFLNDQPRKDVAATLTKIEMVREMARHELPEQIRSKLVKNLRGPIHEFRPTKQIRVLFSWEHDRRIILLLDAGRKKNGTVDEKLIERAERFRDEWLATRNSDALRDVFP